LSAEDAAAASAAVCDEAAALRRRKGDDVAVDERGGTVSGGWGGHFDEGALADKSAELLNQRSDLGRGHRRDKTAEELDLDQRVGSGASARTSLLTSTRPQRLAARNLHAPFGLMRARCAGFDSSPIEVEARRLRGGQKTRPFCSARVGKRTIFERSGFMSL
jgi:hypothetical protein